jgi:hypothetical protein
MAPRGSTCLVCIIGLSLLAGCSRIPRPARSAPAESSASDIERSEIAAEAIPDNPQPPEAAKPDPLEQEFDEVRDQFRALRNDKAKLPAVRARYYTVGSNYYLQMYHRQFAQRIAGFANIELVTAADVRSLLNKDLHLEISAEPSLKLAYVLEKDGILDWDRIGKFRWHHSDGRVSFWDDGLFLGFIIKVNGRFCGICQDHKQVLVPYEIKDK